MKAAYERIADGIRSAIESGELAPGAPLPSAKKLMAQYDVRSQETALKALRLLESEGVITIQSRVGATVRQRPNVRMVVRDRHAYRDEIGYFFDQGAKDWTAIGAPTRGLEIPPKHIAHLLGIPADQDTLVRDRLMGPRADKQPLQIATSYIPLTLMAELPVLGAEKAGPGGIYDRIEDHFGAPIEWRETISSRLPDTAEQTRLGIPPTVPLLVVTRESRVQTGAKEVIAEVNETRMAAEQFAVSYTVERDESARWPREDRPVG